MTVSQRLDIRQSQTLVMTPQLRQAIKLLQMSNQDLGVYVEQEIEQNPLLERVEESDDDRLSMESSEPLGYSISLAPSSEKGEQVGASPVPDRVSETPAPAENEVWDGDSFRDEDRMGSLPSGGDDAFAFATQSVAAGPSLREHLLGQIHVDFTEPAHRMIAVALVEMLDESGYLPAELDLVRAQLGAEKTVFEQTIAQLQRLDPPGIFARSLAECLAIQLREKNRLDPAMQILLKHLDLVAKHDRAALMKRCGVDAEDLAGMLAEVRALNPKPAEAFTSDVALPVVPDVLLRPRPGGVWQVELNSATLPRVLANEIYYARVQKASHSKTDKEYLSERWQQASWLVKALHQRATTILKVASEIVRQQDAFFVNGVQYLRPLILRDIAAAVELHESTVSRVTQNKYIATPRGLFELKYFFTNAIATTGGAVTVSAEAVRDRIKALIEGEGPKEVLSDDKLMLLLRREGIDIARRTVAKYREALRIPTSSQRRREKREGS